MSGEASAGRRFSAFIGQTALFALLLYPFYPIIFRITIFNTFPRDDYGHYFLALLGAPGGDALISPYGYRVFSMLVAAPLYYLMPSFTLTNLPTGLTPEYVRAIAALTAVSYLALVASAALAYRLVRDWFGLGRAEALFAGLFMLIAQLYAAPFGVDPLALFIVLLALYFIGQIWTFAAIMIVSVGFNEKVAIVLAVWLTIRCVLRPQDRAALGPQWVAAIVALVLYAALVALINLPGHGEQFDIGAYLPTIWQNITASVTPRGVLFNILPCALLLGAVVWSWRVIGVRRDDLYVPLDLLMIPALAAIALALTQFYQVGRVVAHGAPLFIYPVTLAFGTWMRREG